MLVEPAVLTTNETESFEAVYVRLRAPLVRVAYLLLGGAAGTEGAEDVVHDAFVRYRERHGTVDSPDAYLRQAVVNGCRDRLRHAVVRRDRLPRLLPVPADAVTHVPELDETWAVLARLPERHRAALVLRFYEDLSEAEIARLLGCRPGTVKSLIHRGLARVKEAMG